MIIEKIGECARGRKRDFLWKSFAGGEGETYPLDTPEVLGRVIRAVGDEAHPRVIFDAQNVLTGEHLHCQEPFFQEWLEVAAPYIDVPHRKDFTIDETGKRTSAVLVREGLKTDFIPEELDYLKKFQSAAVSGRRDA